MRSIKMVYLCLGLSFLVSCVKETERVVERPVPLEKTANPDIQKSFSKLSANKVTLAKSALEKVFILIPSYIESSRTPSVEYVKPILILFQRNGDRIALFNVTEENLYESISAPHLMQTFKITGETADDVTFNLANGFTSFDFSSSLQILDKNQFDDFRGTTNAGQKPDTQIRESFIKSVKFDRQSIFIEQIVRIAEQKIKTPTETPPPGGKSGPQLETKDQTSTVIIELKPYVPNLNFKDRIFDKEFRVGFFLNLVTKKASGLPVSQITRWDTGKNQSPIMVRLHEDTPSTIRQTLIEGITYWNSVFDHEVLQIGPDFNKTDQQTDRSIFIWWINWPGAGFARAGLQADPKTGEIFRGQVFMTSDWYDSTVLSSQFLFKSADVKKVVEDTVRQVIAHEMGHVLGLRHNFAGSSTSTISDEQIENSRRAYLQDPTQNFAATLTTVMDYENEIETALNGSTLKNQVLAYDKSAIDWAYHEAAPPAPYLYCSDEQISFAQKNKKQIYGCDRFDSEKNQILAAVHRWVSSESQRPQTEFLNFIRSIKSSQSDYQKTKPVEEMFGQLNFEGLSNNQALDNYAYQNPSENLVDISTVIDNFLTSLFSDGMGLNSSKMNEIISRDSKAVGGLAGIIEKLWLQQDQAQGQLYSAATEKFFQNLNPSTYDGLITPVQMDAVKEKMKLAALTGNQKYYLSVLAAFPFKKTTYSYDAEKKQVVPKEVKLSSSFDLGPWDHLLPKIVSLYETALQQKSQTKKIMIGEKELTLQFPNSIAYYSNQTILNAVTISLFPEGSTYAFREPVKQALQKMKLIASANTRLLLNALGVPLTDTLSAQNLEKLLAQVDWTKTPGLASNSFSEEMTELKKLEALGTP